MFGILDFFGDIDLLLVHMASEMVVVELPHLGIIQKSSVAISDG